MALKRYVAVTDFYIWAENDEDALKQARHMAALQSTKNDDRCSVSNLYERPDGISTPREIKIN
jgi:hypothetical protein